MGDAAFTPDELKERRVAALKIEKQQDVGYQSSNGNIVGASRSDASMGDLMGLLEEVHSQDLVDAEKSSDDNEDGINTTTKVRRARYAI